MNDSLSILLPVHNAQATLAADVAKMLDLLPEVSRRFDLLIVDDGSTDATAEIAHELAIEYPQVRLMRHSRRRGFEASLIRALEVTDSQLVLGHVGRPGVSTGEIERSLRAVEKSLRVDVAATVGDVAKPQTLHPAAAEPIAAGRSRFVEWVKRRIRTRSAHGPLAGHFRVLRGGRIDDSPAASLRRVEPGHASASSSRAVPSRPKFLTLLKDFAVGE